MAVLTRKLATVAIGLTWPVANVEAINIRRVVPQLAEPFVEEAVWRGEGAGTGLRDDFGPTYPYYLGRARANGRTTRDSHSQIPH